MNKGQLDRIYALFEKVRSGNATEEEKREYVQVAHEAGFVGENLYNKYCRGEDDSWAITMAKFAGVFVRLYYRPEDFQPMEKLPKDLVKVTITEKKRVLTKKNKPNDPNVFALIDDPKVDIYVSRKDIQLFHEEMTLFRTKKDMGMITNL